MAHQPFAGRERAIRENSDIASTAQIFERMEQRQKVETTDIGRDLQQQIDNLKALLQAFRDGVVVEAL